LKLLEGVDPADLQRPEMALYYAVLLSAAGDREKAKEYARLAEKASVLPEEKAMLQTVAARF
jgi:hypothetical protein